MAIVKPIKRRKRDGKLSKHWSLRCIYLPPGAAKRRDTFKATIFKQKRHADSEAIKLRDQLEDYEAGRGPDP